MIEDGLKIVEKYARLSGFGEMHIPSLTHAPHLPADVRYWKSAYAQFLVIPTQEITETSLRANAQIGQEWLDLACIQQEQSLGHVVDGYLLQILNSRPAEQLLRLVRTIELNPTGCRKHVAWPLPNRDGELRWLRIFRVTALGIPPSPSAAGMPGSPLLSDELESEILDTIRSLKSPRQAAIAHSNNKNFGSRK